MLRCDKEEGRRRKEEARDGCGRGLLELLGWGLFGKRFLEISFLTCLMACCCALSLNRSPYVCAFNTPILLC